MKKQDEQSDDYFSYPTAAEIKAAEAACCGKCCLSCETPSAYAWRRRDIDMAYLLRAAIEQELTEPERETTLMFWFEKMSISQIAAARGVNQSAVSRTLDRAKEKLHRVLKYAVEYQRSLYSQTVIHSALSRAAVIAAARETGGENLGERLRLLRVGENLSREALSHGLMVPNSRVIAIETGRAEAQASEIISISAYFNKTTDYLLKGD